MDLTSFNNYIESKQQTKIWNAYKTWVKQRNIKIKKQRVSAVITKD